MNNVALARLHGIFNVLNGLWPLLHMHSFEAVFGLKTDKWLVRTVASGACLDRHVEPPEDRKSS